MRQLHRVFGVALIALAATAPFALAQGSRCADCHFANAPSQLPGWSGFALRHLQDYDLSPHSRHGTGCDSCHGGNPTTFEKFLAHKDMLPPSSPASPAHKVNLPNTCGACHTGPFVAFQKSQHYALLQAGDDRGPTCSTCHGEVAANLLSPTTLGKRCATCHGEGRPQARPGRAEDAQLLMTEVQDVRTRLKEAQSVIRRIRDKSLRAEFEQQWRQAEIPLIEARNAGHEFVFDNLKERLERARQRADALMDALANQ